MGNIIGQKKVPKKDLESLVEIRCPQLVMDIPQGCTGENSVDIESDTSETLEHDEDVRSIFSMLEQGINDLDDTLQFKTIRAGSFIPSDDEPEDDETTVI